MGSVFMGRGVCVWGGECVYGVGSVCTGGECLRSCTGGELHRWGVCACDICAIVCGCRRGGGCVCVCVRVCVCVLHMFLN